MSVAADVVSQRMRMSDPLPTCCSACFRGAQAGVRFVDFDAAYDAGAIIDTESGALLASIDDLHLCESCVQEACEIVGVKPVLHQKNQRDIRRLEIEVEHWRAYAERLEGTLEARPELAKGRRGGGR